MWLTYCNGLWIANKCNLTQVGRPTPLPPSLPPSVPPHWKTRLDELNLKALRHNIIVCEGGEQQRSPLLLFLKIAARNNSCCEGVPFPKFLGKIVARVHFFLEVMTYHICIFCKRRRKMYDNAAKWGLRLNPYICPLVTVRLTKLVCLWASSPPLCRLIM